VEINTMDNTVVYVLEIQHEGTDLPLPTALKKVIFFVITITITPPPI
jgi:hypothetical protein